MKTVTINSLQIQNFKGLQNLNVDFSKETTLRGRNGTGKTSVADAIWWVLFGKDSKADTKFPVKPKDANGQDIHRLITEVIILLDVDGEAIYLARRQEEKWRLPNGEKEQVFDGNVQTLLINDSVVKTQEYAQIVSGIVDEELFKLLTSPTYFMGLKWQDRRGMLLSLIGDESYIDNELKELPEFAELAEEWGTDLNKRKDFQTFYQWLVKKSKTDRDEYDAIPTQIQALQQTFTVGEDKNTLSSLISGYQAEIASLDEVINAPEDASEPEWLGESKKKVSDLTSQFYAAKEQEEARIYEANKNTNLHKDELNQQIASLGSKKTLLQNDKALLERDLAEQTAILEKTRAEFISLRKETAPSNEPVGFVKKVDDLNKSIINSNPTVIGGDEGIMHQTITRTVSYYQDLVTLEIQPAIDDWKKNREVKLLDLETKGKQQGNDVIAIKDKLAVFPDLSGYDTQIAELTQQITNLPQLAVIDPDFGHEILAQIAAEKQKIASFIPKTIDKAPFIQKRAMYQTMLSEANRKMGQLDQQDVTRQKITELEAKEETLLAVKTKYEILINSAKDFEYSKNIRLEDELSKHFDTVKWKLFEPQNNGGFTQTCEAVLNGKPYTVQSTGEKIATGVDIIKTFQKVKEVKAPIIVDNREALTIPLTVDCQVISMYVDESKETLEIV